MTKQSWIDDIVVFLRDDSAFKNEFFFNLSSYLLSSFTVCNSCSDLTNSPPYTQFINNEQFVDALRRISGVCVGDVCGPDSACGNGEVETPCPILWLNDIKKIGEPAEIAAQLQQELVDALSQSDMDERHGEHVVGEEYFKNGGGGTEVKLADCTLLRKEMYDQGMDFIVEVPDAKLTVGEVYDTNEDDRPVCGEVYNTNEDGRPVCGEVYNTNEDGRPVCGEVYDTNEDDRPVCSETESIDNLRSDLSELVHLELNKDTNNGDRETTQNIIGFDHLSQEVTNKPVAVLSAQNVASHQDLMVCLSVSKSDHCKKSATNLHLEMDIVNDSVSLHMKIGNKEQDACCQKAEQYLALDLSVTKPCGEVMHPHMSDPKACETKSVTRISDAAMFESKLGSSDLADNIRVSVHVHESAQTRYGEKNTTSTDRKPISWTGIVNPGFKPEDDDDEAVHAARQLTISQPGELWRAESGEEPLEAYNFDSNLPELRIDDCTSDLGDTNEDVRDIRCVDDTVEEIEPLVNAMAKEDNETNDDVDTNEDIRPLFENMAAFDHLCSDVTMEGHQKVELKRQADSSLKHSDINLHLNLEKSSLKIGLELKSPSHSTENVSLLTKESLLETGNAELSFEESPTALDNAEKAWSQAVLNNEINSQAKHLYSDELYVSCDNDCSRSERLETDESSDITVCSEIGHKRQSFLGSEGKIVFSTEETSEVFLLNEPPHDFDIGNVCFDNKGSFDDSKFQEIFENLNSGLRSNPLNRRHRLPCSLELDDSVPASGGTRTIKTITRSTHLDYPALIMEADITVQKIQASPSRSELGELSAAVVTRHEDGLVLSQNGHQEVVSNESHGIINSEDQAGLNDMVTFALTCMDTVFWFCLVIAIILFEMCKCYWLFVVPGCLFILSVLVYENPKPTD